MSQTGNIKNEKAVIREREKGREMLTLQVEEGAEVESASNKNPTKGGGEERPESEVRQVVPEKYTQVCVDLSQGRFKMIYMNFCNQINFFIYNFFNSTLINLNYIIDFNNLNRLKVFLVIKIDIDMLTVFPFFF